MKKWNEMEILLQNYKKKNDKLEAESKSKFKDQNKEIEGLKEKYEEKMVSCIFISLLTLTTIVLNSSLYL